MNDLHSRIKEARIAAGYRTATAAAEALGESVPTYTAHENGNRTPDHAKIQKYARRFKVSTDWIITGRKQVMSEAVIAKAISALFKAVPKDDLIKMDADSLANLVITIAQAYENETEDRDAMSNVVAIFASRMAK